jgi:hypothetical protein
MNTRRQWLLAGALLAGLPAARAFGDVPQKINDEGRLYDASSNAPVTGSHTLKFAIYSASAGGAALWSQTSAVMFDDGFFEATLDGSATATAPFPGGLFDGTELFLGVTVDSDIELTPREPFDSVPYAFAAGTVVRQMCPPGYKQDTSVTPYVDCKATIGAGQVDEVVRVGDFWIDRYEMANCSAPSALGTGTSDATTAIGCSVSGLMPQDQITWFQANQMCLNAGKHMCTNMQWQGAVAGTVDPGASDGSGGACLTQGAGPRPVGMGTACISRWGAEDMIGNVDEMTADWGQAGAVSGTYSAQFVAPWPGNYGDGHDDTFNVNGAANIGPNYVTGLPTYTDRGGGYGGGTTAGAFFYNISASPSTNWGGVGTRCCVGGY